MRRRAAGRPWGWEGGLGDNPDDPPSGEEGGEEPRGWSPMVRRRREEDRRLDGFGKILTLLDVVIKGELVGVGAPPEGLDLVRPLVPDPGVDDVGCEDIAPE